MKCCTVTSNVTWIVTVLLFLFSKDSNAARENEARLIHDLLKDYDPDARPVKNTSHTVTITVNLLYNQLQDLDEPTQVVRSLVWITMYWQDEFLKWNASEYGGSSRIRLEPTRVWKPDLTLYNNAKQDGGKINSANFKIVVSSNGNVKWFTYEILHSVCHIDVSNFPFDTQKCKMKIGSWTHDQLDLDLKLFEKSNGIDLYRFKKNAVWELKSAHAQRHSVYYTCCLVPYIDITYTFEFRRKPLYYIMAIVFPSMLLSLLSCISFLFPADSGERVSLVISVLLGLVVFMLIVNDRTPVTSDSIPMITQFFNSIGATTVLALMATAFILRLNHVSSEESVPNWLARIRDCFAIALCMRRGSRSEPVRLNLDEIQQNEAPARELNLRKLAEQEPVRKTMEETSILKELQKFSKHLEEEQTASEKREDWHYTMRVFDRFFFVLFFLIFLAFAADVLFVFVTS